MAEEAKPRFNGDVLTDSYRLDDLQAAHKAGKTMLFAQTNEKEDLWVIESWSAYFRRRDVDAPFAATTCGGAHFLWKIRIV